jgi:hypothetical protein
MYALRDFYRENTQIYSLNDFSFQIVSVENDHFEADLPIAPANWTTANNQYYKVYDTVHYANYDYICIRAHYALDGTEPDVYTLFWRLITGSVAVDLYGNGNLSDATPNYVPDDLINVTYDLENNIFKAVPSFYIITGGSGGAIPSVGEVAYGSYDNDTNTLQCIFEEPAGLLWDYAKADYGEDDVVQWQDSADDNYDWVALPDYVYPPSTKEVWDRGKSTYSENDIVQYGDPVLGYIAQAGYSYPTNPYDPIEEPSEYEAWVVPPPPDDPTNWSLWTEYSPDIDEVNWKKKAVPVKCIIYGTEALREAIPYFMPKDKIMVLPVGAQLYFVGYCQKWGECP